MSEAQKKSDSTLVGKLPEGKDVLDDFSRYSNKDKLFTPAENESSEVTLELNKDEIKFFPNLSRLIDIARDTANKASLKDANIPEPDFIQITNNAGDVARYIRLEDAAKTYRINVLRISADSILKSTGSVLAANITHEFGHVNQNLDSKNSDEFKRINELAADRTLDQPIQLSMTFLMLSNLSNIYNAPHEKSDHPNVRSRIEALLEKAYGDSVFNFSGEFGADHHFHPARQDNVPVTEEGYKITNWDKEISPNIKKWVAEDMKYLDAQVSAGMTVEKLVDFTDREVSRVAEFKAEFKPEGELASPEYIASHFLESLKDSNKVEQVKTMHPSMSNVYDALDISRQYATLHLSNQEKRSKFVNCVADNLAQGIRDGQLLNNTNQSNIDTDMQNACHAR